MSTWVLVRGLAREHEHWGDFPARLHAAMSPCQVLTPDLPGNGLRYRETSPTRIQAMADALARELEDSGHRPPYHVIALSLGAMVAVSWAQRHPDALSRMVLINTSMRPFNSFYRRLRPGVWPALIGAAVPGRTAEQRERAILAATSNDARARALALPTWACAARSRPVTGANLVRQLWAAARFTAPRGAPTIPTLILASTQDRLASVQCSRTLAARWHCPIVEHPTAGHDLPLDAGDWVVSEVARWIQA
ncbi:alpha/beta fold hydrolase [Nitrogeniibacter aestuarii]|uniref:alpha/beta fold hydrolase n=1 Tax=Nitrogeniibacter aestuarii TaxID=2815343 RepID=UPI001D127416|nr:alpha/beta hydrolase [Nitrogeniibacter aestuarii]